MALLDQVDQAGPGVDDEHVDAARQILAVLADRGAAEDGGDLELREARISAGALGDLAGELPGGGKHQHPAGARAGATVGGAEPVDRGQHEGRGLAGAGLGDAEQIAAGEDRWDRLLLDGRRMAILLERERLQDGLRQPEGLKGHENSLALCGIARSRNWRAIRGGFLVTRVNRGNLGENYETEPVVVRPPVHAA